jgi:hypothetical protein
MGIPIILPSLGIPAYRPLAWSQYNTTSILVPGATLPNVAAPPTGLIPGGPATIPGSGFQTGATLLVFDAVIRLEHRQELSKTSHPVQTGANITDHSFIEPARLVLEIAMSDAIDSYQAGMWTAGPSKSVSAYQTLLAIQQSRVVVQVTTRLGVYQNMLIKTLSPIDSVETRHGLRAAVVFEQILMASVTGTAGASSGLSGLVTSLRPQMTDLNSAGTVQSTLPSLPLIGQNNVSGWPPAAVYPYVPGAGNWSSNPTAGIPALPLSIPGISRIKII